jgi:hypothetical protein
VVPVRRVYKDLVLYLTQLLLLVAQAVLVLLMPRLLEDRVAAAVITAFNLHRQHLKVILVAQQAMVLPAVLVLILATNTTVAAVAEQALLVKLAMLLAAVKAAQVEPVLLTAFPELRFTMLVAAAAQVAETAALQILAAMVAQAAVVVALFTTVVAEPVRLVLAVLMAVKMVLSEEITQPSVLVVMEVRTQAAVAARRVLDQDFVELAVRVL